ncbi:MAG: carbon starvation protein A [candidate division WOR-3 bacterium]
MNVILFILLLAIFIAGYFFYGNFLSKILGIDENRKTPAFLKFDGVDYVPAKNPLVLFGHHFSSIAGAGPIIGPIFAYIFWGWLGVLLWILFGSILLGGVHDFVSMFISVREEGKSIGDIAEKYISKRAGIVFLIFLWFALILVIAVFASLCAKTFVSMPQIVLPSIGLIFVAIFTGFLIYKTKFGLLKSTILGIFLLFLLIILGEKFPIKFFIKEAFLIWVIILLLYSYFASILPVNILLQPRDYLSSFLLFFGISVMVIGIILKPTPFNNLNFLKFSSPEGFLFPIMFITVACGAISGFHSLVSSGTTSKQIANEKDIKRIGYGAMLLEGILAMSVLFIVAFGVKEINLQKTPPELFSIGFSKTVFFLGKYSSFIALLILNTFILTTLDTATRITRFIFQEITGFKNIFISTFIVILVGAYFLLSGTWQTLWPLFGASNQLVAAIALLTGTAWLINKRKNCLITLVPAIIMLLITLSALIIKIYEFLKLKNYLLFFVNLILIFLGFFIVFEFLKKKES